MGELQPQLLLQPALLQPVETVVKVEVSVTAGAFRQNISQLPPRSRAAW